MFDDIVRNFGHSKGSQGREHVNGFQSAVPIYVCTGEGYDIRNGAGKVLVR